MGQSISSYQRFLSALEAWESSIPARQAQAQVEFTELYMRGIRAAGEFLTPNSSTHIHSCLREIYSCTQREVDLLGGNVEAAHVKGEYGWKAAATIGVALLKNTPSKQRTALKQLEEMAEAPDPNPYALYLLGRCYQLGKGVMTETCKAFSLFRKAAHEGFFRAFSELEKLSKLDQKLPLLDEEKAFLIEGSLGKKPDEFAAAEYAHDLEERGDQEGFKHWIIVAARCGDLASQRIVARQLCEDSLSQLRWALPSAIAGNAQMQSYVAAQYEKSVTAILKNREKAFYWYHQAARVKEASYLSQLGSCYVHGVGTPQSFEKGKATFLEMIHLGFNEGHYLLANMLIHASKIQQHTNEQRVTNLQEAYSHLLAYLEVKPLDEAALQDLAYLVCQENISSAGNQHRIYLQRALADGNYLAGETLLKELICKILAGDAESGAYLLQIVDSVDLPAFCKASQVSINFLQQPEVKGQLYALAGYLLIEGKIAPNLTGEKRDRLALNYFMQALPYNLSEVYFNLALFHVSGRGGLPLNEDVALDLFAKAEMKDGETEERMAWIYFRKNQLGICRQMLQKSLSKKWSRAALGLMRLNLYEGKAQAACNYAKFVTSCVDPLDTFFVEWVQFFFGKRDIVTDENFISSLTVDQSSLLPLQEILSYICETSSPPPTTPKGDLPPKSEEDNIEKEFEFISKEGLSPKVSLPQEKKEGPLWKILSHFPSNERRLLEEMIENKQLIKWKKTRSGFNSLKRYSTVELSEGKGFRFTYHIGNHILFLHLPHIH